MTGYKKYILITFFVIGVVLFFTKPTTDNFNYWIANKKYERNEAGKTIKYENYYQIDDNQRVNVSNYIFFYVYEKKVKFQRGEGVIKLEDFEFQEFLENNFPSTPSLEPIQKTVNYKAIGIFNNFFQIK